MLPATSTIAEAPFRLDAIQYCDPRTLKKFPHKLRKRSDQFMVKLRASIQNFGIVLPILIDSDDRIIGGEALVDAAISVGLRAVPTICISHLSPTKKRMLRIALNRLPELSEWDHDALRLEFGELLAIDSDCEIELTGFDTAEIDQLFVEVSGTEREEIPEPEKIAISRTGETWVLGRHRLRCGSALDSDDWQQLMNGQIATMIFTDPPYNVPVAGHISVNSKTAHREFAMASGEMSREEFETFLTSGIARMINHLRDGGIAIIAMDWRHLDLLYAAAERCELLKLNLCIWNKTNGGMGSMYRSKHEAFLIVKKGKAPHINNVQLGRFGRYRSNVWDYAGATSFGKNRDRDLADHPTVKPTALVADAIRDVSKRGDIVIDGFIGSGATILAAERTQRRCFGMEIDPLYVDVAIRRWQAMTGEEAVVANGTETFNQRVARIATDEPEEEEHSFHSRQISIRRRLRMPQ